MVGAKLRRKVSRAALNISTPINFSSQIPTGRITSRWRTSIRYSDIPTPIREKNARGGALVGNFGYRAKYPEAEECKPRSRAAWSADSPQARIIPDGILAREGQ